MQSAIRNCLIAIAAMILIACSGGGKTSSGLNPTNSGGVGITVTVPVMQSHHSAIREDIVLPSGQTVSTVNFTLTNSDPTITPVTGTASVTSSTATASFIIDPVFAASGYTVSLTATTDSGSENCSGADNTAFTVNVGALTKVNVNLLCATTSADSGAVEVTVNAEECPVWAFASADSPTVVHGGNTGVYFGMNSEASNGNPTPAITVTTGTGTLSNISSNAGFGGTGGTIMYSTIQGQFNCPNASEVDTITLTATTASADCASDDTTTLSITCQ